MAGGSLAQMGTRFLLSVSLDQALHFSPSTFLHQEERDYLGSGAFSEPCSVTVAPLCNQSLDCCHRKWWPVSSESSTNQGESLSARKRLCKFI